MRKSLKILFWCAAFALGVVAVMLAVVASVLEMPTLDYVAIGLGAGAIVIAVLMSIIEIKPKEDEEEQEADEDDEKN